MNTHDLAKRFLLQPDCGKQGCPFSSLQRAAKLAAFGTEDPVAAISGAIRYTESESRTIVHVEAHALHELLDRLVAAEKELSQLRVLARANL